MRGAFIQALVELAERDARILLLTGDLGYLSVEPFADRFPKRFFNVGVAEQNMIGLATGLAEAGFIPFVYSIVPFAVLRPYEFIRNGPALHRLPVRIIGTGGGVEYGHDGASHFGLEDIGVLRIQPGVTIVTPADFQQARSALLATWNLAQPVYYRLGKDDRTILPGLDGRFDLGRAQTVAAGSDLLMVTQGSLAPQVTQAAQTLAQEGISAEVMVVACMNPSPEQDLARAFSRFPLALTVEAHYRTGALGSLAAEIIAEQNIPCRLVRCGVPTQPDGITGSQEYMLSRYGLTASQLAETARSQLRAQQKGENRRD